MTATLRATQPSANAPTEQRATHAELHGMYLEDLAVGMTAVYAKTVTDADIVLFAGISGDVNPVHLNQEFAAGTMFEGRIAHGMLSAGLISAVIGTKLPGPGCLYLGQSLKFLAPVKPGQTVRVKCTVKSIDLTKDRIVLETICRVAGEVVIEGEALIKVPSRYIKPKDKEKRKA